MLLNQLEEPHQLVLLRQPQALILEYHSPRVRHARQFPILVIHEARVNAHELYVLVGSRFQYQIHEFISAKQNPRSAQVDVEFSRMFLAKDVGGKRGNFDVGEEGTGGGPRKRKSWWADDEPKPLPTSLPIQLPNFMKELTDVRDYLVP